MRWKPCDALTVDLSVKATSDQENVLLMAWEGSDSFVEVDRVPLLCVQSTEQCAGLVFVSFRSINNHDCLLLSFGSCTIAEFLVRPKATEKWLFVRWRPDRFRPNHHKRVQAILEEAENGFSNLSEVGNPLHNSFFVLSIALKVSANLAPRRSPRCQ